MDPSVLLREHPKWYDISDQFTDWLIIIKILDKATNKAEIEQIVEQKINEFAESGYRTLGVGKVNGEDENAPWEMQGLISLFDPPRDDTRDTIQKAMGLGIVVKMLTGDQQAIAKETARRLGMGTHIYVIHFLSIFFFDCT